jgi:hypothetical protein
MAIHRESEQEFKFMASMGNLPDVVGDSRFALAISFYEIKPFCLKKRIVDSFPRSHYHIR